MAARRYRLAVPHFGERLVERGFLLDDALHAIRRAVRCEPYPGAPKQGGTCWRIFGPTLDSGKGAPVTKIEVGVETFADAGGEMLLLVTLFNPSKKVGRR